MITKLANIRTLEQRFNISINTLGELAIALVRAMREDLQIEGFKIEYRSMINEFVDWVAELPTCLDNNRLDNLVEKISNKYQSNMAERVYRQLGKSLAELYWDAI